MHHSSLTGTYLPLVSYRFYPYNFLQHPYTYDVCTHLPHHHMSVYSLVIHPAVVDLAKVEFSRFRDVREAIQQYDGVVASCLVLAFQGSTSEDTLSSP